MKISLGNILNKKVFRKIPEKFLVILSGSRKKCTLLKIFTIDDLSKSPDKSTRSYAMLDFKSDSKNAMVISGNRTSYIANQRHTFAIFIV